MQEGVITLTKKEQRTNDVLAELIAKRIKVSKAMKLLGLSKRQVLRKKKAYLESGIKSIPHKNKNKSTGRGYSKELKATILNLYETEYPDYNFYHFNDTLEDDHAIKVSDSFIYNLLTTNGITTPNNYKKRKKAHPPRDRRKNAGELIQCDASKHQWFFGDDTYYYLHGGIDDATGIVTGGYFLEQETIFGYQMIMQQTIMNYGIPECLYTDYRTIFKSSKKELTLEEELDGKEIENTKFSKMLNHLGTDIISTMEPRAKGRIERLWGTFQDRLYKELKKNGIANIKEANDYLANVFIPKYNARFASTIDDTKNSFVLVDKKFDYNCELAIWEEKSIHHNCYLKINNKYHVIYDNNETAYINTKDKVRVYTFLDGSLNVYYKDKFLKTKMVDNFEPKKKEYVKSTNSIEETNFLKAHKPSSNHPWVVSQKRTFKHTVGV